MKSSRALVSIVIPSYNASRYIRETIESVLVLAYRNFEVIAVLTLTVIPTEAEAPHPHPNR